MPQLHILSGKRQGDVVDLKSGDEVDIGNRKSAKLSIRDPWVSYNHARILTEAGRFVIEDQESSNGTWLDAPSGPKKIKRHELTPNDVFALGKTRIRFVADVPAAGPATRPAGTRPTSTQPRGAPGRDADASLGAPGATKKLAGDPPQAWWDKGVEVGPSKAEAAAAATLGGGGSAAAARADGSTEQQLREERRMREALERFLELPPGSSVGDAAKAGALEREVEELKQRLATHGGGASSDEVERQIQDRVEKVRRELMTRQVEIEGRASAAEGKLVDLERRLVEKSDQSKKEVARAREKAQTELDELKQALEEARKSAKAGGDAALAAATQRVEKLEQERDESRDKAERLERELAEAKSAAERGSASPELQAKLEKALAEAESWKREHQAVIQEIDEISMEQIEIEDGLKARIRELESRLREQAGGAGTTAASAGAAAPSIKAVPPPEPPATPARATVRPAIVKSSAPVAPPLAPAPSSSSSGASDLGEVEHSPDVQRFADETLGVLPRSELGAPSLVDDGDSEGSADTVDES